MFKGYAFQLTVFFILTVAVSLLLIKLSGVLAPFVVALIFSYFLAPFVQRLQRYRISRTLGTIITILLLLLFLILLSMTVIPVLYQQLSALGNIIFSHTEETNKLIARLSDNLNSLDPEIKLRVREYLSGFATEVLSFSGLLLSKLLHSGAVAVNIISFAFITPIVLFYTLRDWNTMILGIKTLLPNRYANISQKLLHEIDTCLTGFIRGQSLVCLILGLYYATALSFVGIESGFALGVISGILTFIPYAGALFSSFLCLLVTAMSFGDIYHPILVIIIFIIGQFLESNFLVPKIVGEKVHLHPVWIMFGLMAGGALVGFVGVLLSLPITAIIGVIVRFSLHYYYKSNFYVR